MNFRRTVSALDIEFKCLTRIHKTRYFIISIKFLWLLVNVKQLNDDVCIPNDFSTVTSNDRDDLKMANKPKMTKSKMIFIQIIYFNRFEVG